jgi:hypothetical protein
MAILRYNAKVYDDTAANLATDQTVYQPNEFIFATDTGVFKRGNGADVYADLDPIGGGGGGAVAWADVTGKPTTFPPAAHAATLVNVAADATNGITAGNAQVVLSALAARIKALESA